VNSIQTIAKIIKDAGHEIYLVGGCVRDNILGRTPKDYDFTTSAMPDQIKEIFEKYNDDRITIKDTGLKHLTLTIVIKDGGPNEMYEITTFRTDHNCDGRHADVEVARTLEEDCKRRDFTMNALALDPITGEIIDYFDGQSDIKRKIIRAIGDPEKRMEEDWLRMLRAMRFRAQLGFNIDESLSRTISKNCRNIASISKERIRDELFKILGCPSENIRNAIYHLEWSGLLKYIVPPVQSMKYFSQSSAWHRKDVYEHTIDVLENVSKLTTDVLIRFAALIHDTGKLLTRSGQEGMYKFTAHAYYGGAMARIICDDLKMKRVETNFISKLVASHMDVKHLKEACDNKPNRRLFSRFIRKHVEILQPLILLGKSDIELDKNTEFFDSILECEYIPEKPSEIKSPLDGNEIMEFYSCFEPGPWIKNIKNELIEKTLEGEIVDKNDAFKYLEMIK